MRPFHADRQDYPATPIAVITGTVEAALSERLREHSSYGDNRSRLCQAAGRDPRRDFGHGPVEAYRLVCFLEPGHADDHVDAFDSLTWHI